MRALISGETGGIGAALAHRLREDGEDVLGLSRRDGFELTDPDRPVALSQVVVVAPGKGGVTGRTVVRIGA